jgi:NodT family efflux transporter outer membrane factor (OMF) lipoprotein
MALALPALVTACVVGPRYRAPEMATAPRYAESAARPLPSTAVSAPVDAWWMQLGDPQLDGLVTRALAANLDLETAASRVREARLQEISAGAAYWPSVKVSGAAQRTRLSENAFSLGGLGGLTGGSAGAAGTASAASLGFGLPGDEINTFQLGFDASWQLDFFGRTRRTVEAADADSVAAIWDLRDTQVSVAAEVAGTYLGMRYTEERIRMAKLELSRLEQTLHLLQVRASGGLASQLDVRQQQTEVAASAARVLPLESQARLQNHALAVLLGEAPEGFLVDTTPSAARLSVPPEVPSGLPSELLRRRPDIRRAERRIAAATARTGVAVADLYPQFSLSASPSLSSSTFGKLLSSGSGGYSLGASLVWPLFNAGRTRANIDIANEGERQALIAYRRTVLTALKEVEDALSRTAADQARQASLEQSAEFAEGAEQLAREQYQGGLVDFSRVLNAQGTRLTADADVAQGRATIAQDWVTLHKALGGGWRNDDSIPKKTATEEPAR